MSARDLLESLFEAWSAHDALRSSACFAPDGVYREANGREVVGRGAIADHFGRFFRGGPAWRFDVDQTIVEGERAAVVYRFAVKGHAPKWSERAGCAIVRFEHGLVGLWHEYHSEEQKST